MNCSQFLLKMKFEILIKYMIMRVFYESKLAKMLLLPGYSSITLGCFVFTKKSEAEMEQRVLNHESIHVRQWEEVTLASAIVLLLCLPFGLSLSWMLITPLVFYFWYGVEWLIRLHYWIRKGTKETDFKSVFHAAYRSLSFEREAYNNEHIEDYLKVRKLFESFMYL